ncbi:hypothetical protein K438DRAFT_732202 [Mycena galopus ATCC 62051]|nr:hypothetical protein K438DRAFT_732202 [Mycena galopus ATCC 62051]
MEDVPSLSSAWATYLPPYPLPTSPPVPTKYSTHRPRPCYQHARSTSQHRLAHLAIRRRQLLAPQHSLQRVVVEVRPASHVVFPFPCHYSSQPSRVTPRRSVFALYFQYRPLHIFTTGTLSSHFFFLLVRFSFQHSSRPSASSDHFSQIPEPNSHLITSKPRLEWFWHRASRFRLSHITSIFSRIHRTTCFTRNISIYSSNPDATVTSKTATHSDRAGD